MSRSGQDETLKRTMQVLQSCAIKRQGQSFNALKKAMGDVAPTTLTRLLKSMCSAGMLQKHAETGFYQVGQAMVDLAGSFSQNPSRRLLLNAVVAQLAEKTGQSAVYFDWQSPVMVMLIKHEQPEAYHYRPLMTEMQLTEQGFGLPILANIPETELSAHLKGLKTSGLKDVKGQLAGIRTDGVMVRHEVTVSSPVGAVRIASPVFLHETVVAGSIGVTTFVDLDDDERVSALVDAVKRAAIEATTRLKQT